MSVNMIGLYVACAAAWTVVETQLSVQRMEDDPDHWLQKAMRAVRDWTAKKSAPVSIGVRMIACFGLAIAAWVPVLLVSICWPVTVFCYVVCNWRDKD
ncbi:hypothetical protein GTB64_004430 [Salmonella enterica]|nr:hypothetical protein [Salmonella enterica]